MKIHYLSFNAQNITGGHSYNGLVLSYLRDDLNFEIKTYPLLNKTYSGWRKIVAPFAEIKMLRHFSKGDVVFFGDTSYKYHLLLALLTLFFPSVRTIVIIHHFPYLGVNGIKRCIPYLMQRTYYGSMKYIIVPSPYTKSIAERLFKKRKIVYIPLPFSTDYTPSESYISGNLLYVGTVEPRKGIIYLLMAANKLREENIHFHVDIVGKIVDNDYYNMLEEYIDKKNLEEYISFRGRVSDEVLDTYYSNADLFVFPSLLEGYGIVLVEAMRKGLPIIAFNNSAMPYSIKDGENGYLAANKDYQDLADKIKLIINNHDKRKLMQTNIANNVRNLKTKEDFYESLKSFIAKLN